MLSDLASLVPILKAPWPCLKVFRFSSSGLFLQALTYSNKLSRKNASGAVWGNETRNSSSKFTTAV